MDNKTLSTCQIVLYSLIGLILTGCMGIKPGATRGGKNLYESFFVGEAGTQYFIKPLTFETNQADEQLLMDFGFRYLPGQASEDVRVAYSLRTPQLFRSMDTLLICSPTDTLICTGHRFLFNEKKKDFLSRFETQTKLDHLKSIFAQADWRVTVIGDNYRRTFTPIKKKKIDKVRDYLFVLFE